MLMPYHYFWGGLIGFSLFSIGFFLGHSSGKSEILEEIAFQEKKRQDKEQFQNLFNQFGGQS